MNATAISMVLLVAAAVAGCSNVERSRNLADAAVPGRVLAVQVCSECHGIDGNSVSPNFPRLAAQQPSYIVKQLKDFRSHQRSDPPGPWYMWGISRFLTDEQIAGLAEYYSTQTASPNAVGDAALIAGGREIYENGIPREKVLSCSGCHGAQGQGIENFPRLAYQHADYTEKQLGVFQFTQGRPGTPMESISHPLTGGDKKAIAAYLQAFPNAK